MCARHTSTAGIEASVSLAGQASLLGEFLTNEKPCLEKQGGRCLRNSRECPLISTHMHIPTRANNMQMKSPEGRGGLRDYRWQGTGSLGPQHHLKATMIPPDWEEPKQPLLGVQESPAPHETETFSQPQWFCAWCFIFQQ